ncbi:hypothetical protein Patl1_34398 [Pistacia atlantica]|uniref:Uncharacterized protein n=1 Tax=Pistacia atlantica TaxID=434234 RepID=A0ACC0ZSC1_9ROSI|nr:hypothetical protein Patl1_34398 [Pistacia atlantica]
MNLILLSSWWRSSPPPLPMICFSSNCRGLGNSRTVRELHHWVKTKCPDFVFLMETKCKRNKLEIIRNKIGFSCSFVVDSRGASGGIAMLWKDDKEVDLLSYTQHHISFIVNQSTVNQKFILTSFYGHPEVSKRSGSWNLLRELKVHTNMAWLCVVKSLSMEISSPGIMAERAGVTSSDHKPILIQIKGELETDIKKHRPFRYEAAWDNKDSKGAKKSCPPGAKVPSKQEKYCDRQINSASIWKIQTEVTRRENCSSLNKKLMDCWKKMISNGSKELNNNG